jgi:hypothetical protein
VARPAGTSSVELPPPVENAVAVTVAVQPKVVPAVPAVAVTVTAPSAPDRADVEPASPTPSETLVGTLIDRLGTVKNETPADLEKVAVGVADAATVGVTTPGGSEARAAVESNRAEPRIVTAQAAIRRKAPTRSTCHPFCRAIRRSRSDIGRRSQTCKDDFGALTLLF